MRSASWCVVMEPSTRPISYGPFSMVRLASGKCTSSTAAATSSSSSSASSKLSWQPSQEENLKTAMRGLRRGSELILVQQLPYLLVPEHRSVATYEIWPVLAVSAQARAALHISLHR